MTSRDTLPRGVLGLRYYYPRTVRVTVTSWDTLPRGMLGPRQTMTTQDCPETVTVTMTTRVVLGQNMALLDLLSY